MQEVKILKLVNKIPEWGEEVVRIEYIPRVRNGAFDDQAQFIRAAIQYTPYSGVPRYKALDEARARRIFEAFNVTGAAVARNDKGQPLYVKWPRGDFQDYSDTVRHGEKFPSMHGKKQRSSARKGGRSRDSFSFAKAFERGF